MLAVREPSEQIESPSNRTPARAQAAPAGAPQRCAVAGCGCGGTCAGHAPGPAAAGRVPSGERAAVARRRGPLPLDGTLARAVLARSSSSGSSGGGAGGSGGGGAPVAGAACKVDVRATHIGGILSGLPIWHLFVVTTDGAGTERYYRGGPGGSGGAPPPYGTITTHDGLYVAGTVDWSPGAPSKTVLSGPTACGHDACLTAELRRIDGTSTAYAPTGPNSNTVASTILANCNIPRGKPVWVAPGWSDPAI